MDLYAYANIDNLEEVMKVNNIEVPRLRGLRLMANEHSVTKIDISKTAKNIGLWDCQSACCSGFKWNASWVEYSSKTKEIEKKYLVFENGNPVDIRWDKVHGKKRKLFKYRMKKAKQRVEEQYAMFNKYAGRNDVLYIHARIGGGNWNWYNCDEAIKAQPWFLDVVGDASDCTYVDIYAKIEEVENETD